MTIQQDSMTQGLELYTEGYVNGYEKEVVRNTVRACRLLRAHACYHPRSPTNIQRGQVIGALSFLKRFKQGQSWGPVSKSAIVKNALIQDCRCPYTLFHLTSKEIEAMGKSIGKMETPGASKDVKVVVNNIHVKVEDKTVNILTQKASPQGTSKGDVLFLHGQSFSSQTWVDLKTLQLVADLGYNAVAIDLPNTPKSKSDAVNVKDRNKFLEDVIKELKLRAPVIISPSMTGSYSLPYLFHTAPDKVSERMSGFVPVAPVSTEDFTSEQYKQITIPVSIVYGENDKSIGPGSVQNLRNFPSKELHELKGAGHAAYMNKTDEWHTILTDFLKKVYS